jgi:hypothetical protein
MLKFRKKSSAEKKKMDKNKCPFLKIEMNFFPKILTFFRSKLYAVNGKNMIFILLHTLKNTFSCKQFRGFFRCIQYTTKNPMKYFCEICNFSTSNSKDYKRHLSTAKHKIQQNTTQIQPLHNRYYCECGKSYSHRGSLYNHKKSCGFLPQKKTPDSIKYDPIVSQQTDNGDNTQTDQIYNLFIENQEFKKLLIEQNKAMIEQQNENHNLQKQLLEVVKDGRVINNNTTNNNNQKFNLNFFLNTTCKDAMNMSEFIENIEIDFKDIENIGKNGYVSGMTDVILSRIKDLDVTKRPLHCTDLKRETMYIKDNDKWSKDTPNNTKLHNMISCVAQRNCATVPLWREKHPESQQINHPQYEFCINMMKNVLGDIGSQQTRLDNKVIRNLSKHIIVNR